LPCGAEIGRVGGPLVVQQREHRDGDLLDVLERGAARGVHEALVERLILDPLRALGVVDDLGKEVRVAPFRVHIGDGEKTVEVVEADVLRLRLRIFTQVPLADRLGDVADLAEELRQRCLALEPPWLAVHRRALQAVAHGQTAGEQRGARGRARGLRVHEVSRRPRAAS